MESKSKISFNNVGFNYPTQTRRVINNFNFEIPLNSSTSILGLNGTGKSTLLLLILGYLAPLNGEISMQTHGSHSTKIGYLAQSENLPFDYSVNEFVLLGRAPTILFFEQPNNEDIKTRDDILALLGISNLCQKRLGELSGGELQRVRIGRTLAQKPEIVLLDEPMTHLDIKNKKILNQIFANWRDSESTIIYSTHDPEDAINFSDYCIILGKEGRYIAGETTKLITSELLSTFFEVAITVKKDRKTKRYFIY